MTGDIVGGIGTSGGPEGEHLFIRVGNFYVNSKLGLRQLGRYLWEQSEQFLGSEGKSPVEGAREAGLPPAALKVSRTARHLALFLRARLGRGSSSNGTLLKLPVPGDLAIVRRSGAVKVLDVENRKVFTVIRDPRERTKLRERVGLSEKVAHLPFAPGLDQVDLNQGFFAEEFLSGSHPLNFAGCKDDFAEVYKPLLVDFLTAFPPSWESLSDYVESLRKDILDPDGLLQRMGPEQRETVTRFVQRTAEQLAGARGRIPLVLSHGDYFSGNIVIDESGFRAIDWANMGFRSPLHDLYYLYVNHCCRVMDWHEVEGRAAAAARKLVEGVEQFDLALVEELRPFLEPSDLLRRLFYLECIQVPLVRCTDPTDRYLASMLVRVGWFEEFESELAKRAEEGEGAQGEDAEALEAGDTARSGEDRGPNADA